MHDGLDKLWHYLASLKLFDLEICPKYPAILILLRNDCALLVANHIRSIYGSTFLYFGESVIFIKQIKHTYERINLKVSAGRDSKLPKVCVIQK